MTGPYSRAYRRSLHRDLLRMAAIVLDGLACLFAVAAVGNLWQLWHGAGPASMGERIVAIIAAVVLVVGLARSAEWLRAAERADRAGDE